MEKTKGEKVENFKKYSMTIKDALMYLTIWNDREGFEKTGRKSYEWIWSSVGGTATEENYKDIKETDEFYLGYAQAINDLNQYFCFLRGPLREKELEIQRKQEELGADTVKHYGYEGMNNKPQ
jgi:hypothetical protein